MEDIVCCPSALDLLGVWEAGLGRPAYEVALLLLERACPGTPAEDLARWSIGRRDAALFLLRETLFGTECNSVVECPNCSTRVELSFSTAALRDGTEVDSEQAEGELTVDGYHIRFRVPDTNDLAAVRNASSLDLARERLLERCAVAADAPEECKLPASVQASVMRAMADADPLAATTITVVCDGCSHSWTEIFDIAAWLSTELSGWVKRILREVHALAAAYGWREADIVAMSPTRRRLYLDLLACG
jgi:hypothetical protein